MGIENLKAGDLLRQAREGYGLTLGQVEQDIKIRERILRALENGDFGSISGGLTYITGHTRSYAEYLRLDGDAIIAQLKVDMGVTSQRKTPELVFPAPANDSPVPHKRLIWGSVVVVIVIMLGGTLLSSLHDTARQAVPEVPDALRQPLTLETKTAPADMAAQQAADMSPAAAPVADAPQSMLPAGAIASTVPTPVPDVVPEPAPEIPPLVMKALQDSWMEVRTTDGKVVYSGLLKSGKSLVLREKRDDLLLTTGNAGGIEIYVNGQALPQLGAVGQVKKDISLDPARLQTQTN